MHVYVCIYVIDDIDEEATKTCENPVKMDLDDDIDYDLYEQNMERISDMTDQKQTDHLIEEFTNINSDENKNSENEINENEVILTTNEMNNCEIIQTNVDIISSSEAIIDDVNKILNNMSISDCKISEQTENDVMRNGKHEDDDQISDDKKRNVISTSDDKDIKDTMNNTVIFTEINHDNNDIIDIGKSLKTSIPMISQEDVKHIDGCKDDVWNKIEILPTVELRAMLEKMKVF
jgi:hypothetical protein